MTKWNRIEIETLITLYEENLFLYDTKHEDYHNRAKRDRAIEEFAEKLSKIRDRDRKFTLNDVKSKIKTLRTQFAAEKQHMLDKMLTGEYEEKYEPKLWCYDSLKFLDNYIKEKPDWSMSTPNFDVKPKIVNVSTNKNQQQACVEKRTLDKEEAFGNFVAAELKQLTDPRIYHDTKWKIQLALKEGIEKQVEMNNEGYITMNNENYITEVII